MLIQNYSAYYEFCWLSFFPDVRDINKDLAKIFKDLVKILQYPQRCLFKLFSP